MVAMSQQELTEVTLHTNGYLLLGGTMPLYLCEVHRGEGELPFYVEGSNSWGEQTNWISQWVPVLNSLSSNDPALPVVFPLTKPRPYKTNEEEKGQALFGAYQLYTFKNDDADTPQGEVGGFWKLVYVEDVNDPVVEDAKIPRGP